MTKYFALFAAAAAVTAAALGVASPAEAWPTWLPTVACDWHHPTCSGGF